MTNSPVKAILYMKTKTSKVGDSMKELNDYLTTIVQTAHHCAHCTCNCNGICYFAYECILYEFGNYTEEDELE